MKLLLDSHALIWAVDDPLRLSAPAGSTLRDPTNQLLVSAATIWELAIKVALGKLTLSAPYRQWMSKAINDLGATVLPITLESTRPSLIVMAFLVSGSSPVRGRPSFIGRRLRMMTITINL